MCDSQAFYVQPIVALSGSREEDLHASNFYVVKTTSLIDMQENVKYTIVKYPIK